MTSEGYVLAIATLVLAGELIEAKREWNLRARPVAPISAPMSLAVMNGSSRSSVSRR